MAITDIADQYYTYDGRLASFQSAQPLSKRRTSNATSKAPKSIKWPHSSLPAEQVIAVFWRLLEKIADVLPRWQKLVSSTTQHKKTLIILSVFCARSQWTAGRRMMILLWNTSSIHRIVAGRLSRPLKLEIASLVRNTR
jgi:hypothetical protein